ncbi:hypothetical protein HMPREF0281_00304 [Corynebacterium ammoniagenes DSM 20306]|uniref:Uncharacterized protein n=1 Tax=Corynebacterium ammoniagenes DSM 20306 TaxID=649754 RepID=A0ABN0AHF0_CORAM|nr:hypothetical protein HMPREF0281_00304 [Corynebacterium ammoniagenes DSM 20306]
MVEQVQLTQKFLTPSTGKCHDVQDNLRQVSRTDSSVNPPG